MRKILLKLLLFIIPVLIYAGASVYIDAYNVFHVEDIRLTRVTPNQNFIKTKYILDNKDKFNAFVFGSSRAANLPVDGLPGTGDDGTDLRWYNMTYAMGCPEENYLTIRSLVDGGVQIDELVILIDEISMWKNAYYGRDDLIYTSYQTYEQNKPAFYYSYIKQKPLLDLLPSIHYINKSVRTKDPEYMSQRDLFYSYGVDKRNTDMTFSPEGDMLSSEHSLQYTEQSTAVKALKDLKELCDQKNIKLIVLTSPIYESTYREGVENGYLQFLHDAAQVVDYYCFSGLNSFTQHSGYYFDSSHFKPYVGYEMEKVVFGSGNNSGKDDLFGVHVTADNADSVIEALQHELDE